MEKIMLNNSYSRFLITILIISNIISTCADDNPQEDDVKKPLEYFVQDNQLGAQWPHGIVPYYFNLDDYDYLVSRRVRMAMNNLEDSSCIKFKPLPDASHFAPWIHISNPNKIRECVHTSENKTDLEIPVVIGYDCLQRREILHSLMHAIGFKDEVAHPLRDQYVRIQWENINPKYHHLFRIRYDDFCPVKVEYDPNSIMHFHDRAFSRNGQATIAPVLPGLVIDPSGELSPLDKMKLRLIFGHECNKRRVGDLLDSCKLVMRNESAPLQTTTKKVNLNDDQISKENENDKGDAEENDKGDSEENDKGDAKENKSLDEPEEAKLDEPEIETVGNENEEQPAKKGSEDESFLKKHRRHHRYRD